MAAGVTQKAWALLLLPLGMVSGITIHSSVRSDAWLAQYPVNEQSAPTTGRRVQIVVGGLNISSPVQSVLIDGYECTGLPVADDADLARFDWCRAHANSNTGQLWISFHTRNDTWGSGSPLSVQTGSESVLMVSPMRLPLLVSYVTTMNRGTQAVIHVHSAHTGTASITALLFDGVPVLQAQLVVRMFLLYTAGHAPDFRRACTATAGACGGARAVHRRSSAAKANWRRVDGCTIDRAVTAAA
jgi:hypothetical protein